MTSAPFGSRSAAKIPPLCRYCGKALPKRTRSVWFGRQATKLDDFWDERTEKPTSKEEAQRLLNRKIVSVRWSRGDDESDRYIWKATTWDGESYAEPYFCNNVHAIAFANLHAEHGAGTVAYSEARAKRFAKLTEFDQARVQRKAT